MGYRESEMYNNVEYRRPTKKKRNRRKMTSRISNQYELRIGLDFTSAPQKPSIKEKKSFNYIGHSQSSQANDKKKMSNVMSMDIVDFDEDDATPG